jgi:Lon protease-like protein
MVTDALRDAGLIAVALCPPRESAAVEHHDFVCVARIVTPTFFAPAANHIQIQGVCRALLISRQQTDAAYQHVTIETRPDHYATAPVIDRRRRHDELLAAFRGLFPHIVRNDLFQLWANADLALGELCDQIADQLPLAPLGKQRLLAESNVDLRSDLLLAALRELLRGQRDAAAAQSAIPRFSAN